MGVDERERRRRVVELEESTDNHGFGLPPGGVHDRAQLRFEVIVLVQDQVAETACRPSDSEHEASPALTVLFHRFDQVVPALGVGRVGDLDPQFLADLREGLLVVQVERESALDRVVAHAGVEPGSDLVGQVCGTR